jgi:hypothetical protein
MLQFALDWLQIGIAVIPIFYKSKKPALRSWIEFQSRLPTEQELNSWFSHKLRNLAIITGWQNLVVIDFDTFDKYSEWLQWATVGQAALVAQYSVCAVTARGVHIYIKCSQADNMKLPGVDIKACGGYVLAPPSVHPSGVGYTWLTEGPIMEVDSLEEVIPDTWLSQHNTEQPIVTVPILDPWEAAGHHSQIGMGTINRIKQQVKITDLLPAIKSSKQGWYKTLCPFHTDNEPSFWVDDNRGLCGCYACGGKPMDVINLYARLNQVDNRQAIQMLGERI